MAPAEFHINEQAALAATSVAVSDLGPNFTILPVSGTCGTGPASAM